jgi:uncharacterized protein YhhL (DUF1145 family)
MKEIVGRQLMFDLFSSSVIRKTLVAFVFLCMLVNGFTPRSEEGRNSFVVVMACAMENAVSEIFVSCNEALTSISNKITNKIYALILSKETNATSPVKQEDNKKTDPVNTTSDSGIVSERRIDIKGYNCSERDCVYYANFSITKQLYKLYENIKINCNGDGLGILLFVLFAILVIKKKDEIEDIKKSGTKRLALVR